MRAFVIKVLDVDNDLVATNDRRPALGLLMPGSFPDPA
jgi:hypothetical protein